MCHQIKEPKMMVMIIMMMLMSQLKPSFTHKANDTKATPLHSAFGVRLPLSFC